MEKQARIRIHYLLVLLAAFDCRAFGQATPCDPGLKVSPDDPRAYTIQTDDPNRCEGLYLREDGGVGSILLVGLQKGTGQLDPSAGSVLATWREPQNAVTRDTIIRLRAYSLEETIHYRMDARITRSVAQFQWPMKIPGLAGLRKGEFGLIAWIAGVDVFGGGRDVYLPISVDTHSGTNTLTASFWAPFSLSKVTLEIRSLTSKSQAAPTTLPKPGQYPPARRIDFALPSLPLGFSKLTVSGEDESGNPLTDTYVIYVE
jgi:hypothetical protein